MRRKLVAVMLAVMVVSTSVVGCGESKTSETESKKVQTATVKTSTKKAISNHDAIKKYIEKADKIVIVKDAKNLDMEKAVSSMVSEDQKDKVESVTVDDSKVDSTKAGTYPLTITVKLKEEAADQKEETKTESTKTESEDKTGTSKTDSKTESAATDEEKDSKTETDNKQESGKDTIKDTVDVIVADKDKADDLLDNGSAVVGDDSKVEVKDDKQVASNDTKKEETDKKTEEKKEDTTKKEETSKKDDSKKEETKKDTSSKTESSSSDKKQENKNNSSSTTKPSTSTPSTTTPTTNTGNSGNNQGSSNTGNSSQTETKPAHQHNWVAQTHTVHHDATGHNEQYVVQEAWDETVTTYEDYAWDCCNVCGADCTADPGEHMYQHAIKYEGGGWHTEYGTRPVTSTVHHDAVYGTRWVQDSAAYDETVVDGYACSCGARK